MSKTQSERIAALEAALGDALSKINELIAAQAPLHAAVADAHKRIDHAGQVFSALRRAVTPKSEPLLAYIPRSEFDAAVAELRSDAGDDTARFAIPVIRERVQARRTLAANTAAAGAAS